jgi:hypothetical protein
MGEGLRTLLLLLVCSPIVFWSAKALTLYLLYKFGPPHYVELEYKDKMGHIRKSKRIKVSDNKEFFLEITHAYIKSKRNIGKES